MEACLYNTIILEKQRRCPIGNDQIGDLSTSILQAALGYYFVTEDIVSNIHQYGTDDDRNWLATQTSNYEYLAAVEMGIVPDIV